MRASQESQDFDPSSVLHGFSEAILANTRQESQENRGVGELREYKSCNDANSEANSLSPRIGKWNKP